ncbi:hypothetical protein PCE1_000850 [Barthelona sp. PCE]
MTAVTLKDVCVGKPSYELCYSFIDDERFGAEETIRFSTEQKITELFMHSIDLDIEGAYAIRDETEIKADVGYLPDEEGITLNFAEPISGEIELVLIFSAEYRTDNVGLYKSPYKMDGEDHFCLSTQFEPVDARKAYVCYDMPDLKADFDVSITHKSHLTAVSNGDISSVQVEMGYTTTRFQTVEDMPTYLVAFAVSDWDIAHRMYDGVRVGIYTPRNQLARGMEVFDEMGNILAYFKRIFKLDPKDMWPKIDLIAIPSFDSGAMENHMCVFFRDRCLLLEEGASFAHRQMVRMVVAHEYSHFFHGFLVTMQEWGDLWLNEAFAENLGYACVDSIHPDWKYADKFVNECILSGLKHDVLKTSHPIKVPVEKPRQIDEIFDAITYEKGASIVYMLKTWLGEDKFHEALQLVFKEHGHSNIDGPKLWKCFSTVTGYEIEGLIEPWIMQRGFPAITASIAGHRLVLEQTQMNSDGDERWCIPMRISFDEDERSIMVNHNEEFSIEIPKDTSSIVINVGAAAFCAVKYDKTMEPFLNFGSMSSAELSTFIFCQGLFARYHGFDGYFETLRDVSAFLSTDVVTAVMEHVSAIRVLHSQATVTNNSHLKQRIESTFRSHYTALLKEIGIRETEGESASISDIRAQLISVLASFGDDEVMHYLMTAENVPKYLETIQYKYKVKDDPIVAISLIQDCDDPLKLYPILRGACAGIPTDHFEAFIKHVFEEVPSQHAAGAFAQLTKNLGTYKQMFNYIIDNFDAVAGHISGMVLPRIVEYSAELIHTSEHLEKFIAKFADGIPDSITYAYHNAVEIMECNIKYFDVIREA